MPDAEYRAMSVGGVAYIDPGKPPIPNFSATANTAKRQEKVYEEKLDQYKETETLKETLKHQILQAVPHHFIQEKDDPNVGFTNETPKSLVQYMITTYGEITMHALYLNRKELEMRWDPTTNITQVFSNGTRCRAFAVEGNDPISDLQYVHSLVMVFRNSGVLDAAVRDWENLATAAKTVANTIAHFTKANKLRLEATLHLKDVLGSNLVTPEKQALAALPPPPPPPPTIPLKPDHWTYCWSHGVTKHTSAECQTPKEGHQRTATMWKRQGGSEALPPNQGKGNGRNFKGRGRNKRTRDGAEQDS
jgi:hypothetical protein